MLTGIKKNISIYYWWIYGENLLTNISELLKWFGKVVWKIYYLEFLPKILNVRNIPKDIHCSVVLSMKKP